MGRGNKIVDYEIIIDFPSGLRLHRFPNQVDDTLTMVEFYMVSSKLNGGAIKITIIPRRER